MANIPDDRRYSRDHEWALSLGGGRVRIGLTDHAQRQLGDVVYVESPTVGDRFDARQPFGTVESVKAVSEVYMPVPGTVAAVNDELAAAPEQVNEDPYGDGWLIEITATTEPAADGLLTAAQYADYVSEEDG
jgi:glycine cleavage system H protein